jgi:hypothetical protein
VANGTCGDLRPRSDYIRNSPLLFDQLYGGDWYDAYYLEVDSISRIAELYRQRLESGYRVWVLDGGPMDFTARVLRYLNDVGTSANLNNITVIQHSHGWNQENTDPVNLAYMQQHARYVKIDNGNHSNNGTAQLNQSNTEVSFPAVDQALVERFRNDSTYGDSWQLAFSLFGTDSRFDGSDTVELLWVLGLDSSVIADWYDFADQYLRN